MGRHHQVNQDSGASGGPAIVIFHVYLESILICYIINLAL